MSTFAAPTVTEPLRGATLGQAFCRFWSQFSRFSGRASLSEFWWMALVVGGSSAVLSSLSTRSILGSLLLGLGGVWELAMIIPMLAVTWRRLHDTNRSGGHWFWMLLPIVGWIILLVLLLAPANQNGTRFDTRDRTDA